jgi:hypothetical protein
MPKTRTILHVHCKSTNDDFYYTTYPQMQADAYKFPLSVQRIKQLFTSVDYFERKGFYFRKSKIVLKQRKRGNSDKLNQ